jgi:LEA14-like dessication related protein
MKSLQKKHFIIFCISLLTFFVTSCHIEPVELVKIEKVDVKGINNNLITLDVTATVKNPNSGITIKDSQIEIEVKDEKFGTITQTENIHLDGHSTKQYKTRINVEISNLKGGIFSAMSLFGNKKPSIKLNGKLKIKKIFYSKTIDFDNFKVQL